MLSADDCRGGQSDDVRLPDMWQEFLDVINPQRWQSAKDKLALRLGPDAVLSVLVGHDHVANQFRNCRYSRDAKQKRSFRAQAFAAWSGVTCATMAAA